MLLGKHTAHTLTLWDLKRRGGGLRYSPATSLLAFMHFELTTRRPETRRGRMVTTLFHCCITSVNTHTPLAYMGFQFSISPYGQYAHYIHHPDICETKERYKGEQLYSTAVGPSYSVSPNRLHPKPTHLRPVRLLKGDHYLNQDSNPKTLNLE